MRPIAAFRGAWLFWRGNRLREAGRHSEAIEHYENAVAISVGSVQPIIFAAMLDGLAESYASVERWDEFLAMKYAAVEVLRDQRTPDLSAEVELLREGGETAAEAKRWDAARDLLAAALPSVEAIGSREDRAVAHAQLGEFCRRTGSINAALRESAIGSRLFTALGEEERARRSGRDHLIAQRLIDRRLISWPSVADFETRATTEVLAALDRAVAFSATHRRELTSSMALAWAVLAEPTSWCGARLTASGVDPVALAETIETRMDVLGCDRADPPFSERVVRICSLAVLEADYAGLPSVTDLAVLAAIVREGDGTATKVLLEHGLDLLRLRAPVDPLGYEVSSDFAT